MLAAAGCLLAPAGSAAGQPAARSAPDEDRARGYWTPERMAAAEPLEVAAFRDDSSVPPGDGTVASRGRASIRTGSLPPSLPEATAAGALRRPRINSGEVRAQRRYPQRANGKLFFSQGRRDYVCSGVVAQSRSDGVILTAGHCVFWRGRWSKRVLFVPAYHRGSKPFGAYEGAAAGVPRLWWRSHNLNFDYGAIKLRRSHGRRVGDVTGEIGVRWGYPRDQSYSVVGYPVNYANGQRMWSCRSRFRRRDGKRWDGPASSGVGCRMRNGSSGGGWTFQTGPHDRPYVGSVTSHYYRRLPGLLFGPFFDRRVVELLRFVNRR